MAVRRLDLIITSNAQAALRGFASLEGAASRMENKFGKAGRALFNLGVIGAGATAVFTAKSVKAFIEFDDAMTRSTAILDNISGPVRKRLEDAAKSIARTTTFSASEAAEAFYGLFSAGLDAEQSISAIPVVAQFAQAALMDMGQATDYLVNAQASLGLKMEDPIENMREMQRVADVLTETNNLATGTVEEFADALTHKAGSALGRANKDIEEGAAALAYFAEQGVRGSRAGESLAIFIRDVSRAAGDEELSKVFREFGIEVFTSTGQLKNLADIVAEFETALTPMSDKQRAVTLEQLGMTRAVGDVIRQLIGGSDEIRKYEEALRNAGGATQEVADKQMESLKNKLEVIKNRFEVLMIEFGEPVAIWLVDSFFPWVEEHLIPTLSDVRDDIANNLTPAFEAMGKALDNPQVADTLIALTGFLLAAHATEKTIALLAAVFGPLAVALRYIVTPIRSLGLLWTWFQIQMLPLVPIFKAVAGVISSIGFFIVKTLQYIFSPIGLVTIELIALTVWLYNSADAIAGFFVRLWDGFFRNFIRPVIDFFTGPFVDFWKALWDKIEGPLKGLLSAIGFIFKAIIFVVLGPLLLIGLAVFTAVRKIVSFFIDHWGGIANFVAEQWEIIKEKAVMFWQGFLFPFLKTAWNVIRTIVVGGAGLVIGAIVTFWQALVRETKRFWHDMGVVIFGAWHTLRDRVLKPLGDIWHDHIYPKLTWFMGFISGVWEFLKAVFGAGWTWLKDNVLKPLGNYWSETIAPKLRTFRDFMGRIWSQITATAASVWNGFVDIIRRPVNAVIRIINALISGINTVIDLINKIPGADIPTIPQIPLIGGQGSGGAPVAQEVNLNPGMAGVARNEMGTWDLAKRGPFKTSGARAIVGEGDPRFPEYVIPTDPRFRGRANALFAGLAGHLGIPGFGLGGIIDSVADGVGGLIDAAGGFIEGLERGALKLAFAPFNEAAKNALANAPNVFGIRDIAQAFREIIWRVVTGADTGLPEAPEATGGTVGTGLGGNRAANRLLGMMLNRGKGWGAHWGALDRLVMSESGWDNNAQNPTSTAYGIGQFLNSTWATVGYRKSSSPVIQIAAMLAYIAQRYGNPSAAWAFKKSHNWYGMGGTLPSYQAGLARVPRDNFPANLHKDEAVLDAKSAEAWRRGGPHTMVNIENLNIYINGNDSMATIRRKAQEARKAFLETLEERRVMTDARIS